MKIILLLSFLFWSACQHKPTVTTTELPVLPASGQKATQKWIRDLLKEDPVILDVRSPFDFNIAHVPSAINVRWEDFSQADPLSRGLLQNDLFALSRRLALIGIDKDRPVLILGKSLEGLGEEGRVAWTLGVLGVKKVYTIYYKEFRSLKNQDSPLVMNKPIWKPDVDESLSVDVKTFKKIVTEEDGAGLNFQPVVIDTRSPELFGIENLNQKKSVKVNCVNIFWKEFFTEKGFVNPNVLEKLKSLKITKESSIYLISNKGVDSAAVTYALRSLGFTKSANFAGGYEQWNVTK